VKELRFWALPDAGFGTFSLLREHLALFCRDHPDIRVSISVGTTTALWDHLFRFLKRPKELPRPDILQIPSHWTASLAHLGLLQDLRELDGRLPGPEPLFAVPWWMEMRVLYYRKDLFRKLGLREEALSAWDGLREACRTLAEAGGPCGSVPIANPNPRRGISLTDVAPCLWSRGADLFAKDHTRTLLQRPDARAGVADYFDLIASGWMPLSGTNGLAPGDLFEGAAAMQFSGRLPPKRAASGEIGVVPFPSTGTEPATVASGQSLAVLRGSDVAQEALGLLRSLTEPARASAYAAAIGAFAPTEDGLAQGLEAFPELSPAFERSQGFARTLPMVRVMGTLERVFERSMDRLLREVSRGAYAPDLLHQELVHSGAEMDYVLGLYL